ncbi:MAG: succinate dehydrogenase, hydrophobic membrane anchor protein [Methylobacterium sp.]|nr:succinate dehydrogenase, hydrophobic membrane anchor protein [Methylobacterium sp.]
MWERIFHRSHAGLRTWLAQRLTGLLMAIYSTLLLVLLLVRQPGSYEAWHALFDPWWMRLLTVLFFFALAWHAWIGVRDIFKDYVPAQRLRGFLQGVLRASLIGYAVWATHIFWSL